MKLASSLPVLAPSRSVLAAMGLLALGIFVVDTATPYGFAVAVLYVVVVLMAAGFYRRRDVLLVAAGCMALTVLSYLLSHGTDLAEESLARAVMSLSAIGITALLAVKYQSAVKVLHAQAELLDLTHDTVFVRDMDDRITYWNRGAEELYGWTRAEAVGRGASALLQTVFPEPPDKILAELLRTDRWEGELVHTRRDGTTAVVASRWALKRDEQGRPQAVLETNNDVTERRKAEEKTRRAEQELRLAIDTIPGMVWSSSPDGSIEFVNARWAEMGLSMMDVEGANWRTAVHPDDLRQMGRDWEQALAAGTFFENTSRVRGDDGAYRWLLIRGTPLRDERGEIIRWYGINTDIDDRKRAEDSLRRAQAQLNDAQRLVQMGSFSFKVGVEENVWSAQAGRVCDYDPNEPLTIDMVVQRTHPDDVEIVRNSIANVLERAKAFDHVNRLLMPDGSIKYVRVLGHRILDETGAPELVGAFQDITAEKHAQEALADAHAQLAHATRVATLGELTASIAHEVNQPLAGIITNGEAGLRWLGREVPQLDEVRSAIERMIRDGQRASQVVQRLRALARKAPTQTTALDLNEVITEAVALVQREVLNNRIALQLDLAPDLPRALGDRVELQQVVINLMINGMQAMEPVNDRPRILAIRSGLHETGEVIVSLQDSGVGIDPDNMSRLFKAFFTTRSDGMGMGLSICRSIVEMHGGRVWASNNAGPGTTFQFTLPLNAEGAP